jgi:hypothetical protein
VEYRNSAADAEDHRPAPPSSIVAKSVLSNAMATVTASVPLLTVVPSE